MKKNFVRFSIVFFVGVTIFVITFLLIILPRTAPYENLIKILKEEKIIKDSIGNFKKINKIPDAEISYNDTSGYARFWIWVYGTKGRADTYIKITNNNGKWERDSLIINKVELNKQ